MNFHALQLPAGGNLEDANGVVRATGQQKPTVRAERKAQKEITAGREHAMRCRACWIDQRHFAGKPGVPPHTATTFDTGLKAMA